MSKPVFSVVGKVNQQMVDALAAWLLEKADKALAEKPKKKLGRPLGNAVRRKLERVGS